MPQTGAVQADASRPRLGLAARLRTARSAIATSFQQPDCWTREHAKLWGGVGCWDEMGIEAGF
jgi:hypothetical protein